MTQNRVFDRSTVGDRSGAAVRESWSPGDLKLLGVMTQIARDPGSLGVDELEVPARLGRVGGSTPGTGMAEARRMRTCH